MGGVDLGGGSAGKRRGMDSEINMIPMIDLLMVTISFLLITAVWTHMARINCDAQVPGPPGDPVPPLVVEKQLHVMMPSEDRFVLAWKQGNTTIDSIEVPRRDVVVTRGGAQSDTYPELAQKIESEWKAKGQHGSPGDPHLDQAVLHTDDKTEFRYVVGVLDAIESTHRSARVGSRMAAIPAFNVTFAMN
jgi:biopolymer transport protein ExbD